MFGKKEKQFEIEKEQCLEKERMQNRQVMAEVADKAKNAAEKVTILGDCAREMDQGLTSVVDYAKESITYAKKSAEDAETLSDVLLREKQKEQKLQEEKKQLEEQQQMQHEDILHLMDDSKVYTGITKKLSTTVEGYLQRTDEMLQILETMESCGKGMGTLALNCAIEAGRMGEGSMKYVRAADDVRASSEQYEAYAHELKENATSIRQSYEETDQEIMHLITLLRDNNVLLGKIEKNSQQALQAQQNAPDGMENVQENCPPDGLLAENTMEELLFNIQNLKDNQKQILDEMETLGASYMRGTESTEGLRDLFLEIQTMTENPQE